MKHTNIDNSKTHDCLNFIYIELQRSGLIYKESLDDDIYEANDTVDNVINFIKKRYGKHTVINKAKIEKFLYQSKED